MFDSRHAVSGDDQSKDGASCWRRRFFPPDTRTHSQAPATKEG
jgi:hypothetical protein